MILRNDARIVTLFPMPGRKRLPGLLLLLYLVLAPWAAGVQSAPAETGIEPTKGMSDTAIDLVEKLENRHYSKRKFDDELSSLLLDNYLRSLDPSHYFFYQSDIDFWW